MEAAARVRLTRQGKINEHADHGVVMLALPDRDSVTPVACWPAGRAATPLLVEVARSALTSGNSALLSNPHDHDSEEGKFDALAAPLVIGERVVGIIAMEVARRPDASKCTTTELLQWGSRQRATLELLQWGTHMLEPLVQQHNDGASEHLVTALELVALCLEHTRFQAAATTVATELATRLSCNRVSIGFLRGHRVQVRAMSHNARSGSKTNLMRDIEAAMEEAIDQDSAVVFPAGTEQAALITHAHAELAERHNNAAVCTVPLIDDNQFIGALTLERATDQPFDNQTVELCTQFAALIGPALELKRCDDRWIFSKLYASLRSQASKLVGPRHTGMKLAAVLLVTLLGFMFVANGDYRVTAKAALEGSIQRVIVAPIDGFIADSSVRAGDLVQTGQLMGELDDKDLKLEQQKWTSQKEQYTREYRNAMASHDRAQVAILSAQMDQARAELKLVEEQLARMRVVAPFDGVVVSGDLSQSLGSPVGRGDILFEVAPLDSYRLILRVEENGVQDLAVGQEGQLRLSGLPGETLPFTVERITPVSETDSEANFFRVEARLLETHELLRPGMEGVAKVAIGERKLIWVWTHKLIDWLHLWLWSWLP